MSGYTRWQDAMVAQSEMLAALDRQGVRTFLQAMQDSLNAQHAPEHRKPPGFFYAMQQFTLSHADPVYVSDDVAEVIDYARQKFQPEPLRASDPFTPHGFALLPRPLLLRDSVANGTPHLPVRAIAWTTVMDNADPDHGAVWISYYTHHADDLAYGRGNAEESEHVRSTLGSLTLLHSFQWTFGQQPWTEVGDLESQEHRCPECLRMVTHDHRDECVFAGVVTAEQAEWMLLPEARDRGLEQVGLAQTMWRIASQLTRAKERAPRGVWKDANRKGVNGQDVTVIRLRRTREGMDVEPAGRGLSVRFVVRGHWRRQPYKDGVRQIWIAPYVKGPDDAPFRATERVWEFVR